MHQRISAVQLKARPVPSADTDANLDCLRQGVRSRAVGLPETQLQKRLPVGLWIRDAGAKELLGFPCFVIQNWALTILLLANPATSYFPEEYSNVFGKGKGVRYVSGTDSHERKPSLVQTCL